MSIKIFCDIADLNLIKKFNKNKIVKGFTTNPSLMRKAGARSYQAYSKQILKICRKKPISFEVFADDHESMIEQGIKIEESLKMLQKANKLRSNDPYIIDSLGWALFKLNRYEESKAYLQTAVRLMPGDPIVNDHFGDVLWKNGNKIQARYYWNYVLNLEKTEDSLKRIIEEKMIKGL